MTMEAKAGDVIALNATTHTMKNLGTNTVRALLVERKGSIMPPMPMEKKTGKK
jgi:hypothetical protein